MEKLDKKFTGVIVKVKDCTIVPDDQYVVFLPKDTAFANILPQYLGECLKLGCDTEQIEAVRQMIRRVNKWRTANPERCKIPDAAGENMLK
jgi:hypothetical protein